jgi:accessory secretory protein Asp1
MFYIAPGWENEIKELTQDLLNELIGLLREGRRPLRIIILNFLPNLRYILHENMLTSARYWSVWDAILDVQKANGMPLTPEELDLPADVELVYSKRSVSIYRHDQFYGKININNRGFVSEVQITDAQNPHTDVYDDRGFKVQTNYYQGSTVMATDWFNEAGDLIVQWELMRDQQVQIMAEHDRFAQRTYENLDQLLAEFVDKMLTADFDSATDALVASIDQRPRELMMWLQNRMPVNYVLGHAGYLDSDRIEAITPQIQGSRYLFVDNQYTLEQLRNELDPATQEHVRGGYPYGTQMRLGNSNEERNSIIYWKLGPRTTDSMRDQAMDVFFDYLAEHDDVGLLVQTSSYANRELIIDRAIRTLRQNFDYLTDKEQGLLEDIMRGDNRATLIEKLTQQLQARHFKEQKKAGVKEIEFLELNDLYQALMTVEIRVNPKSYVIFAELNRARVLVDLGEPYNTAMQLSAISAGIPQINLFESPLVIDHQNGWVLHHGQTLVQGLDYFLQELGNWNQALVESVQFMEKFSMTHQANWWEKMLYGKES